MIAVDASIALKLVVQEPDSRLARAAWQSWTNEGEIIIGCELWTADHRLANAISPQLPWVRLLGR